MESNELIAAYERQQDLHRQINKLKEERDSLAMEMVAGLQQNDTTSSLLLDFFIRATNGFCEPSTFIEYSELHTIGIDNPSEVVMVIQRSWNHTDFVSDTVIRNIHLAKLRNAEVQYDTENMVLGIPVEPGYFTWREQFLSGDERISGSGSISNKDYLVTGPLLKFPEDICIAVEEEPGSLVVPSSTFSEVDLLKDLDKKTLAEKHQMTPDELVDLKRDWIKTIN